MPLDATKIEIAKNLARPTRREGQTSTSSSGLVRHNDDLKTFVYSSRNSIKYIAMCETLINNQWWEESMRKILRNRGGRVQPKLAGVLPLPLSESRLSSKTLQRWTQNQFLSISSYVAASWRLKIDLIFSRLLLHFGADKSVERGSNYTDGKRSD